ncbi:MAG TPA: PQQ-binding-like beta-propeller repeat protein [Candidatus Binatia bacterium]|jgi:outer membrane protein assembly factor BamB|nr:PQQ-binding-like beta-propeller repeat protein [Candidatus Binatia bacterium]
MRRILLGFQATLLALLGVPGASIAWEVRLDDDSACTYAVERDGAGDVLAGSGAGLVKLDRGSGAVVWRRDFEFPPLAIASLPGNDVIVGDDDSVLRLASATGSVVWTHALPFRQVPSVVALDGSGSVFVAITILATGSIPPQIAVRKLDAATGSLVWEEIVAFTERGVGERGLAIAPNGDVVVAGTAVSGFGESVVTVRRLAGATGHEVWRTDIDGGGPEDATSVHQVILDAAGDVLVGGYIGNPTTTDLAFLKLAGGTGVELWRHEIDGVRPGAGPTEALVANTPDGDVMVGGVVNDTLVGPRGHHIAFARLDGATGAAVWSDTIDESGPTVSERLIALLVDAAGNLYLSGSVVIPPTVAVPADVVFAFSGADGSLRWRQDRPGRVTNADGFLAGTRAALGPDDELAVGTCEAIRPLPGADEVVGVVATLTRDGADPLAGSTLIVADRAGRPSSRSVKLTRRSAPTSTSASVPTHASAVASSSCATQ